MVPRFWNLSSQFHYLNISHNQIYGEIPYIPLIFSIFSTIDMSSNHFKGPFLGLYAQWAPHIMLIILVMNNFLTIGTKRFGYRSEQNGVSIVTIMVFLVTLVLTVLIYILTSECQKGLRFLLKVYTFSWKVIKKLNLLNSISRECYFLYVLRTRTYT